VARRAEGFGMRVLHHTRTPGNEPGFVADLDELLGESDIVSLHIPGGPATHHLIDARRLALMKPTAVLVNTARGTVVDELALAEALHSDQLFAAGLDVYEREPVIEPRLLSAPRTVLLPHIGSGSQATRRRMATMATSAVATVLAGGMPSNVVTPT
jgi:glyoxylate reductase